MEVAKDVMCIWQSLTSWVAVGLVSYYEGYNQPIEVLVDHLDRHCQSRFRPSNTETCVWTLRPSQYWAGPLSELLSPYYFALTSVYSHTCYGASKDELTVIYACTILPVESLQQYQEQSLYLHKSKPIMEVTKDVMCIWQSLTSWVRSRIVNL